MIYLCLHFVTKVTFLRVLVSLGKSFAGNSPPSDNVTMKKMPRVALRWLVGAIFAGCWLARGLGATQSFSRGVSAADFSDAGLTKLTAAELARLDDLVQAFHPRDPAVGQTALAGSVVAATPRPPGGLEPVMARAETSSRVVPQGVEARSPAAGSSAVKSTGGLFAQAKVLLTPGTAIEYSILESRLAGPFDGWQRRTEFTLENGQRWRHAGDTTYVTPAVMNPKVTITPGILGVFWMNVEGVKPRLKVTLVPPP
jgi:hypothetical protein